MSVSQPAASQQGLTPAQKAAVGAGAAGAGAAAAPPAAAVGVATMAGIGATAIVASLMSFLTLLREANKRWLLGSLGRYSRVPDDIAQVIADEMRLEELFAQASSDRLAAGLPDVLAIPDPASRAAALKRLLADEERYAQQRQEAMAARAIAAVTRAQLRRDSPLGAFWRLGRAKDHTPGCILMAGGDHAGAGKFWPWAVLDRVHPPRHYGCTSTLHGFGEAIAEGWMRPGDVPDTREAIRAAAGVLMEEWEAEALERELEVREQLVEAGVATWEDLASRPWEGVAEAFTDAEHPRDWKGRFRSVGDVATRMAELSTAWRGRMGAPADPDAPSFQQQVKNWTGHLRGRMSKDRTALGVVAAANAENARLPLYQRIVAAHEPDHVVVITPSAGRKRMSLMDQAHDVPHRVAGTTSIPDETVKAIGARGTGKTPADHPAASSGYGMAAVLRHEYGHSIDDTLPRDVRRRILATIPDPAKDLTYYAGTGDQEVIPELLALITHPDYRREDWPQTVQNAERELLKALGVPSSGPGEGAAAALKAGKPATIKPQHAPALIDALNDGSTSSLHKLQVEGHPNLFTTHARDLTRAQMPQIRKADLPGFMDFLRQHRVSGVIEQRRPSELRATQKEIHGGAVAALAKGWDPTHGNVIMVSQDGDVLDGHHRWAAAALDEMSHPERVMGVLRFSAGTDRILALMRAYNELTGAQVRAFGESSQNIPRAGGE